MCLVNGQRPQSYWVNHNQRGKSENDEKNELTRLFVLALLNN